MEIEIEIDPLSTDLRSYDEPLVEAPEEAPEDDVGFEVKLEGRAEETLEYNANVKPEVTGTETTEIEGIIHEYPTSEYATQDTAHLDQEEEKAVVDNTEENDEKPLAKLKIKKNKSKSVKKEKQKIQRKKRTYNQKVNEDFQEEEDPNGVPYYSCSVCDVKYTSIHGLYNHVLGHKNRLTSWGLRVKNQELKKKLRKEEKRLKKQLKIQQQAIKVEPGLTALPQSLSQFVENLTEKVTNAINNGALTHISPDNGDQTDEPTSNPDQSNEQVLLPHEYTLNVVQNNESLSNGDQLNAKKLKQNTKGSQYTGTDETERKAFNLEKIFKCGHCNKQFHLGYYLKLHVRSHTGEKPYSCEECGISFITASKLGRHKKRTHLSVRFVCRICRRPYTRLEFLTRHFNRHHAADKIEGEPYDYNAILPYLKELEEELQKKKEREEAIKKEGESLMEFFPPMEPEPDFKPKPEALWTFNEDDVKQEFEVKEEIKVEMEAPEEALSDFPDGPSQDSFGDDHVGDEPAGLKDEDDDEDYFPSDTWLPPPSPSRPPSEDEATEPSRKRTRSQAGKGDNPLHCKICNKTLSTQYYLKIHMRTHTGDKPYKCYICNKGFITSSKRNRHVMTHENWEEECKSKLKKEEKGDIKEEPGEDSGNVLNKLAKQSRRPRKLKRALEKGPAAKRNRKKKPFACVHCCSRFAYAEALQLHMHSHQTGEKPAARLSDLKEGGFQCRYCLAPFDDDTQGREHEATHGGPKPYVCTVCGRSYQKKETMMYHRRHHDCPNKYQCDVCPKTFNLLCKLQRHLHSHRPDKYVVRYECPVCAHIFNTKYHIEMHLTTHEKEGVIVQENRGQIIAMVMQNARKIPMDTEKPTTSLKNLTPTDERSRICNICGEIFNHFYYLEQHLKTHGSTFSATGLEDLDERKYICKVCNKGFKLSYYLKLHSYTHTKEKPFICQQCGKGFITRGKLKRHAETHAGVKKYQCHICCKFFTRPSYLRIHVRTIHGNQDYNFKPDLEYDMGMPMSDGMSVMSHGSV